MTFDFNFTNRNVKDMLFDVTETTINRMQSYVDVNIKATWKDVIGV